MLFCFRLDQAEEPSLAPKLWISRWVDDDDGFGYMLSNDSFGALFKENGLKTRLILLPNGL